MNDLLLLACIFEVAPHDTIFLPDFLAGVQPIRFIAAWFNRGTRQPSDLVSTPIAKRGKSQAVASFPMTNARCDHGFQALSRQQPATWNAITSPMSKLRKNIRRKGHIDPSVIKTRQKGSVTAACHLKHMWPPFFFKKLPTPWLIAEHTTKYYDVLIIPTQYYKTKCSTQYYKLLLRTTKYYFVLKSKPSVPQNITKYYNVRTALHSILQSTTSY